LIFLTFYIIKIYFKNDKIIYIIIFKKGIKEKEYILKKDLKRKNIYFKKGFKENIYFKKGFKEKEYIF